MLTPLDAARREALLHWAVEKYVGHSLITEARSANIREGVQRAIAAGKHVGRPLRVTDPAALVAKQEAEGLSGRALSRETGIPQATLRRALKRASTIPAVPTVVTADVAPVEEVPNTPAAPPPAPTPAKSPKKKQRGPHPPDPKIERMRSALNTQVKVYSKEELEAFAKARGVGVA